MVYEFARIHGFVLEFDEFDEPWSPQYPVETRRSAILEHYS